MADQHGTMAASRTVVDDEADGADEDEVRWIEADSMMQQPDASQDQNDEDEDDVVVEMNDLFADPDPIQTFDYYFHPDDEDGNEDDCDISSIDNNAAADTCPSDSQPIHIQLTGYKAELGQTLHSTGLTIWRASRFLAKFLVQHQAQYIDDRRVLELGAGLGLCGILSHKLAARTVFLTDGDTDTLARMRANVQKNCLTVAAASSANQVDGKDSDDDDEASLKQQTIACHQLVWGQEAAETFLERRCMNTKVDTVIGSDIIYVEEVIVPLWETVDRLLQPHGNFLLAYARRNVPIDLVLEEASRRGFRWDEPTSAEGVYVFSRTKDC